jgi:hypothetical protein
MARRHCPIDFNFYCLTNDTETAHRELPKSIKIISIADCPTFKFTEIGSWPVLSMFKKHIQEQIKEERILKLDLDCVITGSLENLLGSFQPDMITGWLDITHKILNPSFALFQNGWGQFIWQRFLENQTRVQEIISSGMADKYGWDQIWINDSLESNQKKFLTKESGIFHRREIDKSAKLPGTAKIVFFNSSWKPWHEKMRLYYPWIKDHYR